VFLLGYDIGSSSIKAALVDAGTGATLGVAQHPAAEMAIAAPYPDWAEQDPRLWWDCVCAATRKLLEKTGIPAADIGGIGIAYQMHGLVAVDAAGEVLRPSIIWCDSRAVEIGNRALEALGRAYCLEHYLNSPGNFTASKLRWVRENEPHVFDKIDKIMLPGDYIAYRMTGECCTTVTGLSEGVFWDFKNDKPAKRLLNYYEIPESMIPRIVPASGEQGRLGARAASELGLRTGIPVGYRAGDQPNNALCLNVLRPGEVAATGGTSGVVYAVSERPVYDSQMRVNSFAHVNYTSENPVTGVLLCINGAGIQYNWMRRNLGDNGLGYDDMELLAQNVAIGSDGLGILPFGNGAERMLNNRMIGARFNNLNFNRHTPAHFYRAALEGIAFSFVYGIEAMRQMGMDIRQLRVGGDNLFRSAIFSDTISTLVGCGIEVLDTTGAAGAAKAAGVAAGAYTSLSDALQNPTVLKKYEPEKDNSAYEKAYQNWKTELNRVMRYAL
jgi:xylulokinase